MSDDLAVTSYESLEKHILLIRGKKVMLSHDLALLYGVETKGPRNNYLTKLFGGTILLSDVCGCGFYPKKVQRSLQRAR